MKFARPINTKGQNPVVSTVYSLAHPGIDYAYPVGTSVYASADGIVELAKNDETRQWIANTPSDPYNILPKKRSLTTADFGNFIRINHDENYSTIYAHLKHMSVLVKPGDRVKKGQLIAQVGSTGNSTGGHTHFEIRRYGAYVDPNTVIDPSFSNYGQTEVPTPPMTTDMRIEYFEKLRQAHWGSIAWESLTMSQVEEEARQTPLRNKRAKLVDDMARKLGYTGDTNQLTVEVMLSLINNGKPTYEQGYAKGRAEFKQAIQRKIEQTT